MWWKGPTEFQLVNGTLGLHQGPSWWGSSITEIEIAFSVRPGKHPTLSYQHTAVHLYPDFSAEADSVNRILNIPCTTQVACGFNMADQWWFLIPWRGWHLATNPVVILAPYLQFVLMAVVIVSWFLIFMFQCCWTFHPVTRRGVVPLSCNGGTQRDFFNLMPDILLQPSGNLAGLLGCHIYIPLRPKGWPSICWNQARLSIHL